MLSKLTKRLSNTSYFVRNNHISSKFYFSSKNSCDVAIVGAGIMGMNLAHQLSRRSPDLKIKVLEQAPGHGFGSTGASSAICRVVYSLDNMARFAYDGIELYKNWEDYLQLSKEETTARFQPTGLLRFQPGVSKKDVEAEVRRYENIGIKMQSFDKYIVEDTWSAINLDINKFDVYNNEFEEDEDKLIELSDDEAFLYEPGAGYFEPVQALTDLQTSINKFNNQNVEILYNSKVGDIIQEGGKAVGVQVQNTKHGESYELYANTVVNCNGPWYNYMIKQKLDGLDINLNLIPVRIQVIYKDTPEIFNETSSKTPPIPIIIDTITGVYMRPQVKSKQILVSTARAEDEEREFECIPDDCRPELGADPYYRSAYLNALYHRLGNVLDPNAAGAGKCQSISGIYTVCEEDVHPIMGETKLKNFWLCNGFSGHGFKCGPAVGGILAKNITGITLEDDTKVPIEFYSPYREPYTLKVKNVFA